MIIDLDRSSPFARRIQSETAIHIDTTEATKAVHAAIEHGINLFDTAESYGPFLSEELLGKSQRRSVEHAT